MNNLPRQFAYVTSARPPEHVFNRRGTRSRARCPHNPFGTIDKAKMNPPAAAGPGGPAGSRTRPFPCWRSASRTVSRSRCWRLYSLLRGRRGPTHFGRLLCHVWGRWLFAPGRRRIRPSGHGGQRRTSGDVNNINFLNPRSKGPYVQMRVADDVAKRVCDALAHAKYQTGDAGRATGIAGGDSPTHAGREGLEAEDAGRRSTRRAKVTTAVSMPNGPRVWRRSR